MRRWPLALLLGLAAAAAGAMPVSQPIADARPPVFRDHAEEARFRALTEQLR
jgi:cytochrome c-type biogenesis protein CcmH/NrfF